MATFDNWEAADASDFGIFKSMVCVPQRLQLACAGLALTTTSSLCAYACIAVL